MTTTPIYSDQLVAAGQTLTFTGGSGAIYTLDYSGPLIGAAEQVVLTFDDEGSIQISSSQASALVQAFADANGPNYTNSLIEISATGELSVSATGSGSTAQGYISASQAAAVENDGTFDVSAVQTAIGVDEYAHTLPSSYPAFDNTGQFTVSADSATGVLEGYAANNVNSAHFEVDGVSSAIGFDLDVFFSASLTNSGTIIASASSGTSYGIRLTGLSNAGYAEVIDNTGTITAQDAIYEYSTLIPTQTPILDLTNSGIINGDIVLGQGPTTNAFTGLPQGNSIVNSGAINGAVYLSNVGNDTYDGRGGTLTGGIYLGGGEDIVYLGGDGETVHGGTGTSIIVGGGGNDTITGSSGRDFIIVSGGNDVLTGGAGSDEFVFGPGIGAVTVTDFTQSQADQIDLSRFGTFHSLADVLAATTYDGTNATIHVAGGTITLDNINPANLTAANFYLGPFALYAPAEVYTIASGDSVSITSTLVDIASPTGGKVEIDGSLSMTGVSSVMVVTNYYSSNAEVVNTGSMTLSGSSGQAFYDVALQNSGTITCTFQNGYLTNGNLINSGHITLSGTTGYLVAAETQYHPALVQNLSSGVLTVSGTGNALSMGAWLTDSGEFDNAGTITVSDPLLVNPYGVQLDEAQSGGVSTSYALINNSGTITVTGQTGESVGVGIMGDAGGAEPGAGQYNIINSGTISAYFGILFYGDSTFQTGIVAHIDNSGTITGLIGLDSTLDNVLLNTGVIGGSVALGDGNNVINSAAGTINGAIYLGAGFNTVSLGNEANTVVLGAGGGVIDGGGGVNTLTAGAAASGVSISLGEDGQAQYTGGAGTLTLSHFENLSGSQYNDVLQGNSGDNILDGGAGINTVSYANATSGVTVSLAVQGQAQNTIGAGTDTLSNFQNLIGSAYSDTLTSAGTGNSSLTGGGGADTFKIASGGANTTITDFSHAQGDQIDLSAIAQFTSFASVMAAATQVGANTVIHTSAGSLTLDNVSMNSLTSADFHFAAPEPSPGPSPPNAPPYPYDEIVYITDEIDGEYYRGSGVIVGPHTILTAAHMVWDQDSGQSAINVEIYPGLSSSYVVSLTGATIHYNAVDDSNDELSPAEAQNDFAIIDVAQNLSAYGWFGIDTDYQGGAGAVSGYPGANGYTQQNVSGTLVTDPAYNLIDYSTAFDISPGSSGGPAWINTGTYSNPVPEVVGLVSTQGFGAQITSADLAQIEGWVAQDTALFADSAGDITGSIFNDNLIGDSNANLIDGKGGSDTMTGGGGADTFVFEPGDGNDTVTDFSAAQGDMIDLTAYGSTFSTLAKVLAASTQSGANTIIHLPGGGEVILDNVALSSLHPSDFGLPILSDFNGDGLSDVIFRDPTTGDWGYAAMNGSGGINWTDVGVSGTSYSIEGKGDFNGDGISDVLFRNDSTGDWGYAQMNKSGGMTWFDVGVSGTSYSIDGTGDFTGNGISDVIFRNHSTGDWGYAQMDGHGGMTWYDIGTSSPSYSIVGTGDFTGDGISDVLFRNNATGDWGYAQMDGHGGMTWVDVGVSGTAYSIVGTGDFNGDGISDVLFRNNSTGDWGYAQMDGHGGMTWFDIGLSSPSYTIVATGDYNGDGITDVAFRNASTGDWGYAAMNGHGGMTWYDIGASSTAYMAI